ncbi:MAG TPA: sulfotransferase [Phenylobacterium sp.]|nr:sulfotransferase [Phenylobacterium sp.]
MNIFFVCGAPKSGTTWVQRILDAHPQICCSGEGHFVERFTSPLAKVLNSYNQQMKIETEQVYEGKPVYSPIDQAEFDALCRGFMLRRMASRAGPQVRWLGDKTPRYTHQLDQLDRLFPECRIIHIVRDPRDVAVSRLGHSHRVGLTDAFTPGSRQHDTEVRAAASGWSEAVSAVNAFARTHPDRVHELRYRDLSEDPIGESARMLGFLGAPADPALLAEIAQATSFEALTGRRRGEEDGGSYFRKGIMEDWKSRLDPQAERAIRESCGELMRQKGFAA